MLFFFSDNGDLFGWGNSEYNQLSVVCEETQVLCLSLHQLCLVQTTT